MVCPGVDALSLPAYLQTSRVPNSHSYCAAQDPGELKKLLKHLQVNSTTVKATEKMGQCSLCFWDVDFIGKSF